MAFELARSSRPEPKVLTRAQQVRYLAQGWFALKPGGLFLASIPLAARYKDGFDPGELSALLTEYESDEAVGHNTLTLRGRRPGRNCLTYRTCSCATVCMKRR